MMGMTMADTKQTASGTGAGATMGNKVSRKRRRVIAAGMVALALVAGACGGGDQEEAEEAKAQATHPEVATRT